VAGEHSYRGEKSSACLISNGSRHSVWALPWEIASCTVRPDDIPISISGDGGLLFAPMDLKTAVIINFNLVHVIWVVRS
jgi:thiamine pyrophosphate-dependent acetolactate synthase large subunit-like protein